MYINGNGALCYDANGTTEEACPVCGSTQIEDTGTEERDGDEYTGYGFKCHACGAGGYRNYVRAFDGYVVTDIPPGRANGTTSRKLRLLLFDECNRSCAGCCNNDFDLPGLLVCDSYKGYELIVLTGGEPMLRPEKVMEAVRRIRRETAAPIILYTAFTADKEALSRIIEQIDGVTVTLHDNSDVKPFLEFDDYYVGAWGRSKSYRLNVFNGVGINLGDVKGKWKVKPGIEWIKDCPLPAGEVLMRFESSERMRE